MANRISPSATVSSPPGVESPGPAPQAPTGRGRPPVGPFDRWPRGADLALAASVAILGAATATTQLDDAGDQVSFIGFAIAPIGAYLLIALSGAVLYWRRRFPIVVLVVAALAVGIYEAVGFPEDLDVSTLIAIYSVGRYVPDERRSAAVVAAAVAVFAVDSRLADDPAGGTVAGLVLIGLTWFVGNRLHSRVQRAAAHTEAERAQVVRAVAAERAHIARELHDVVAHRVSMMTVQSGAAKTVVHKDAAAAAEAMAAVEHEGRLALIELRHLLDVLRPTTDSDRLGPQPGLSQIPKLIAQHVENGMDVELVANDLTVDLAGPVDLSAYRIVQEALTNVLKHAGTGVNVGVRLSTAGEVLIIEVVDDGVGGTGVPGSGYGIIGMRERAQLLGGSLDAGPGPDGGFRVVARLPTTGSR